MRYFSPVVVHPLALDFSYKTARAAGEYIVQFVPTVIIHSVSGQIAEHIALFETHIKGGFTVNADIAQVVIEPLLRDVVTLIDLAVGFRVLLSVLTYLLLDIDLPQLLIELSIATREDQDIIQ